MQIGKDTLYGLIREGKIGTIKINKREKISAAELQRFQKENSIARKIKETLIQNKVPDNGSTNGKSIFRNIKEEILYGKRVY